MVRWCYVEMVMVMMVMMRRGEMVILG